MINEWSLASSHGSSEVFLAMLYLQSIRLAGRLGPSAGRVARGLVVGLLVWGVLPSISGAVEREGVWIEVDPDRTTALRERGTGEPYVAVGVNYFGPHMGWAPKLWHRFDPAVFRAHLQLIRDQGFNTIRVFLTLDSFHQQPGEVREEGAAKFRELIEICRDLGLRVIPSGPDHWEGVPAWLRGKDSFADEELLRIQETWWERFTGMFRDEPVILAWDLLNEPSIRWDSEAMRTGWNDWLRERYGSLDAIAVAHERTPEQLGTLGQIAIPPDAPALNDPQLYDYQQFRESIGDQWTRRLVAAIRRSGAQQLVTVGHIQWAGTVYLPAVRHYAGFDLRDNARHVDFTTIHFYPIAGPNPSQGAEGIERNAEYLEALLHECAAGGKPVMIGEFAWYGGGEIRDGDRVTMPPQTVEDQVAWNMKLLEVSRGRVCGWLHWAFADTPTSRDLTRWSGLWTEDLALKPWGERFGQFARQIISDPEPPRPYDDAVRLLNVDRKAALTQPDSRPVFRRAAGG
jgi:hypothetical protein